MYKYFKLGLATAGMLALLRVACAAPDGRLDAGQEARSESRALDARVVHVRVDGPVDLRVRQGSAAMLALHGDARWMERVTAQQSGDTLVIATQMKGVRVGRENPLRGELVLPQLHSLSLESVGNTEITGFRGEELALALDGAGSMNVRSEYRLVRASLSGVGSLKLVGMRSEGISLDLQGAGFVTLAGRSGWIKAQLGGLGGLDAQACTADSVTLDLSGLGNATVTAHESASLNLSGMGSVTIYGKPAHRKVSVDGLGKVSWK